MEKIGYIALFLLANLFSAYIMSVLQKLLCVELTGKRINQILFRSFLMVDGTINLALLYWLYVHIAG